MSKFYNNQLFYGIQNGSIVECRLIKYDEKAHMLYFKDVTGQSYQCSEYRLDREVFTLKFKAEQHLGIYKPKVNTYSNNPPIPESSSTFSWSGSGIHVDKPSQSSKSIMSEYITKRPLQNYRDDTEK